MFSISENIYEFGEDQEQSDENIELSIYYSNYETLINSQYETAISSFDECAVEIEKTNMLNRLENNLTLSELIKLNISNSLFDSHKALNENTKNKLITQPKVNFEFLTTEKLRAHLDIKRRKCLKRDTKVSRSLALLVIIFGLCW